MDERRQLLFALCASLLLSYCVSVQGYGFYYDPSTDPTHSCYKENEIYVNFDPEQEPFKCLSPYPGMRDEVPSGFEDLETEYVEIKSLNVDASKSTNENKTENEPSLADQIAIGYFFCSIPDKYLNTRAWIGWAITSTSLAFFVWLPGPRPTC